MKQKQHSAKVGDPVDDKMGSMVTDLKRLSESAKEISAKIARDNEVASRGRSGYVSWCCGVRSFTPDEDGPDWEFDTDD